MFLLHEFYNTVRTVDKAHNKLDFGIGFPLNTTGRITAVASRRKSAAFLDLSPAQNFR